MMRATRSLRTVLTVAAAVSMPAAPAVRSMAVSSGAASAAQAPMNDRARFVGTYSLVTTEVKDPTTGKWSQTPNFNSIGYITYSDTGQMGVHIMRKIRAKFAIAQPTPDEAKAALQGYTAYFGPYTVDDKDKFVVHHRVGQINPGGVVDAKRFYDFVPDPRDPRGGNERLILTPAPANGGGKEQATNHLIWERMPTPPLSADAKKFVGFYKLLYTDSYREKDGKEVFHGDKNYTRAGSYIIYTPSGHMMVHLMNKEGRMKYADAQPTPDEALKAYRSYGGYFGRFVTYENHMPQFVLHSQQGTINPGGYTDQKRFYQFAGNVLRLGVPPRLNEAGELAGGHLYWERLTAGPK